MNRTQVIAAKVLFGGLGVAGLLAPFGSAWANCSGVRSCPQDMFSFQWMALPALFAFAGLVLSEFGSRQNWFLYVAGGATLFAGIIADAAWEVSKFSGSNVSFGGGPMLVGFAGVGFVAMGVHSVLERRHASRPDSAARARA